MNETLVTMIGNVASPVSYGQTSAGVPMANFRLAATERRYDRARGDWVDGDTNWVTVVAWRWLAANVVSSVGKGDPVVVSGRLRIREWEEGGKRRSAVEIDARVVGHDLGRGTSAFRWAVRGRPELAGVGVGVGVGAGAGAGPGAVGAAVADAGEFGSGGVGLAAVEAGGWSKPDRGAGRFGDEAPVRQSVMPLGEAVPEWIVAAVQKRRADEAQRAGAAGGGGGDDRGGGGSGAASAAALAGGSVECVEPAEPGEVLASARVMPQPGFPAARPARRVPAATARRSRGAAPQAGRAAGSAEPAVAARLEEEEAITV
ncbi:single-strand DNA-binding protein [Kitasatospora sp. MAP12-15]|uniref:single-stranded DNA-binding protein n=1 Tax=unclassified Kitasatospora TaxID=2633591 RepID=UPI002475F0C6|nr:single-stranded DNA-binding protein [Kitasatospora sp. MAP12-44]MDH6113227.1 single-strand DNA-binding protein [Kitasatospora sp. MAP12-44]